MSSVPPARSTRQGAIAVVATPEGSCCGIANLYHDRIRKMQALWLLNFNQLLAWDGWLNGILQDGLGRHRLFGFLLHRLLLRLLRVLRVVRRGSTAPQDDELGAAFAATGHVDIIFLAVDGEGFSANLGRLFDLGELIIVALDNAERAIRSRCVKSARGRVE